MSYFFNNNHKSNMEVINRSVLFSWTLIVSVFCEAMLHIRKRRLMSYAGGRFLKQQMRVVRWPPTAADAVKWARGYK